MAINRKPSKIDTSEQVSTLSEKLSNLSKKIAEFKKEIERFFIPTHLFHAILPFYITQHTKELINRLPILENLYNELLGIINERQTLSNNKKNKSTASKFFRKDDDPNEINNSIPIQDIEKNINILADIFDQFSCPDYKFHPIILCRKNEKIFGMNGYSDDEEAAKSFYCNVKYLVISSNNSKADDCGIPILTILQEKREHAKNYLLDQAKKTESFSPRVFGIYVDLYEQHIKPLENPDFFPQPTKK